ncbi:MAG TPA: hypothetical protein VNX00_06545 [Herbaspirillum sp.]|jgi:hypothetical protein|nr:hypothetical protein [Herbaspirillum sp.]
MNSFHRADWFSIAQVIASIVAICGAFGVVFTQQFFEKRRRESINKSLKKGIYSIAERADSLVKRITNGSLAREFQDGMGAYRMTVIRQSEALISVIDLISLDKLAEAECLEAILYLRSGIGEIIGCFGNSFFENGLPMGSEGQRFQNARNLIERALGDLGLKPKTIVDVAQGETVQAFSSTASSD